MNDKEKQQPITVNDAVVKSMSIEIKVMKIGNKQVTLAVFRQLPEEPIIHRDTGELCGIPWGRVNYHIDCEYLGSNQHLHVVWQKGSELYRAIALLPWLHNAPSTAWERIHHEIGRGAQAYMAARILEGWEPKVPENTVPSLTSGLFTVHFAGNYTDSIYLADAISHAWTRNYTHDDYYITDYAKEKLKKIIDDAEMPLDSRLIEIILLPLLKKREELRQIWQQSYSELEKLDQLFIAV